MEAYLGIDVGSVSTKFALLNEQDNLLGNLYLPTGGDPVAAVQTGLRQMRKTIPSDIRVRGVATTGSARHLAGIIVGADLVKNEITCHAVAALRHLPGVRTIIEIGGQDSKMIILRNGAVTDFGMNTVCAAGTGSFLDHQASRLRMSIEEMGERALRSGRPARITGKCTVFAESDMLHKQQLGYRVDDIIYGLCQALVRNYLSDVGSGRDIQSPVLFQGGVAFNRGIVRALEEELGIEVIVPPHPEAMGAVGAALLVHEGMAETDGTAFRGFEAGEAEYRTTSFECRQCPALCEIARVSVGDRVLAYWGGRCDAWERRPVSQETR